MVLAQFQAQFGKTGRTALAQDFQRMGWSIIDAARTANVGRSTVYEEIRAGRLVARKMGRRTIILDCDLQAWLSTLPLLKTARS
jgi:excisionase family DNA binding protein